MKHSFLYLSLLLGILCWGTVPTQAKSEKKMTAAEKREQRKKEREARKKGKEEKNRERKVELLFRNLLKMSQIQESTFKTSSSCG